MLGRREDGRHEISTLMQAISMHDLLQLERAAVTGLESNGFNVPMDESNLVLKALRALEAAAERPLPTRISLLKRIPPGSGLGGGSSDAAAALRGLSRLHGLELEIGPIAAELGSDVGFFLAGGRARATGRGERLEQLPDQPGWFAIAWPKLEISTADVYRRWDVLGGEPPNELLRAAVDLRPELATFGERLGQDWQLTGSGSAWFKTCASRASAEKATAAAAGWTAVASSVCRWG